MAAHPLISPTNRDVTLDVGLWLKLLIIDFVALTLQGSVMSHFQGPLLACQIAPVVAVLVGYRVHLVTGAANGLFLGWAAGALALEPTGIPILMTMALGGLANIARDLCHIEDGLIRALLTLTLVAAGELAVWLLTLIIWQTVPPILPLSLLVYVILIPLADAAVNWALRI
jgi:hypothetical protein